MSKTYGFLLKFIPMQIGAGMTFLEVVLCDLLLRGPAFRGWPNVAVTPIMILKMFDCKT